MTDCFYYEMRVLAPCSVWLEERLKFIVLELSQIGIVYQNKYIAIDGTGIDWYIAWKNQGWLLCMTNKYLAIGVVQKYICLVYRYLLVHVLNKNFIIVSRKFINRNCVWKQTFSHQHNRNIDWNIKADTFVWKYMLWLLASQCISFFSL